MEILKRCSVFRNVCFDVSYPEYTDRYILDQYGLMDLCSGTRQSNSKSDRGDAAPVADPHQKSPRRQLMWLSARSGHKAPRLSVLDHQLLSAIAEGNGASFTRRSAAMLWMRCRFAYGYNQRREAREAPHSPSARSQWLRPAITIEQFVAEVDAYIRWYNEKRINISFGSLSPVEYRMSLGLNL